MIVMRISSYLKIEKGSNFMKRKITIAVSLIIAAVGSFSTYARGLGRDDVGSLFMF